MKTTSMWQFPERFFFALLLVTLFSHQALGQDETNTTSNKNQSGFQMTYNPMAHACHLIDRQTRVDYRHLEIYACRIVHNRAPEFGKIFFLASCSYDCANIPHKIFPVLIRFFPRESHSRNLKEDFMWSYGKYHHQKCATIRWSYAGEKLVIHENVDDYIVQSEWELNLSDSWNLVSFDETGQRKRISKVVDGDCHDPKN